MASTQPISTIVHCDIFKATLKNSNSLGSDAPPREIPSSDSFYEIYHLYVINKLNGVPPFQNPDPGHDPIPIIQGTPAAWFMFASIIERFGHSLDENHSNILWDVVATDLGDPSVAPDLPALYHHLAPIVKLWLIERNVEIARWELSQSITLPGTYAHDFINGPLLGVLEPSFDILSLIDSNLRILGHSQKLPVSLHLSSEDLLSLKCPLQGRLFLSETHEYICFIASSEKIRGVARLLPSILAHPLTNIIQWVLDTLPVHDERRWMITKLLQDIANALHDIDCPRHMFCLDDVEGLRVKQGVQPLTTRGSEANMYTCFHGGRQVVIRQMRDKNRSDFTTWQSYKRYKRGLVNYWQIRHENIVEMIGLVRMQFFWQQRSDPPRPDLCMVMPYVPGGTLGSHPFYLAISEEQWIPLAKFVTGIAAGLRHLHEYRTVHGDLHADNILIDEFGVAKISDFGISRIHHIGMNNSTSTEPYATQMALINAPEVEDSQDWRGTDIKPEMPHDVYAAGVVFLCLAIVPARQRLRINDLQLAQRANNIVAEFKRPDVTSDRVPQPQPCSYLRPELRPKLWALIQQMTAYEADSRPSMGKVVTILNDILSPFPSLIIRD